METGMFRGPDGKFQILFICTGNLCRSSFGAELLKSRLSDEIRRKLRVVSAGTHALEGLPATLQGQAASSSRGVDLSRHRSQPLTPWLIEHSDLILVMEPRHREAVLRTDPGAAGRTHLLMAYGREADHADAGRSVEDPYSGGEEVYGRVYREMEREIDRIIPVIEKAVQRVG